MNLKLERKMCSICMQCCGSGSGLNQDSMGSLNPDPGGQKLPTKIEKWYKKILSDGCFF
jgi:hypothetical protein